MVHSSGAQGEFVTINVHRCIKLEDVDEPPAAGNNGANNPNHEFRVHIGHSPYALMVSARAGECVVKNMWIDPQTEIWIASTSPRTYAAYGFVSQKPLL